MHNEDQHTNYFLVKGTAIQLTPEIVDWAKMSRLLIQDQRQAASAIDEESWNEMLLVEVDWIGDSCVYFTEVVDVLNEVLDRLSERNQLGLRPIMDQLLNEGFNFAQDLGDDVDREIVAGTYAPATISALSERFESLDFGEIANCLQFLPPAIAGQMQILQFGAEDPIGEYLQDWARVFREALAKGAGVLLTLG